MVVTSDELATVNEEGESEFGSVVSGPPTPTSASATTEEMFAFSPGSTAEMSDASSAPPEPPRGSPMGVRASPAVEAWVTDAIVQQARRMTQVALNLLSASPPRIVVTEGDSEVLEREVRGAGAARPRPSTLEVPLCYERGRGFGEDV